MTTRENELLLNINISGLWCFWRASNEDVPVYSSFVINLRVEQRHGRAKTLSKYKSAQRHRAERQERQD